jgi:hypothetical protein
MRLAGSLLFAILCWCAVIVGIGSRNCLPGFHLSAGFGELLIDTGLPLVGGRPDVVLLPIFVVGLIAYVISRRLPQRTQRLQIALIALIPLGVFAAAVIATSPGHCPDFLGPPAS